MELYDLTVAYRIYPQVSKIPALFQKNKLKLARLCLGSFAKALSTVCARIIVLLDNCPVEYANLFREFFPAEQLELIHLNGIGNHATFLKQIDVLLNQNFSEAIFFAEDDYFYLPNAITLMLQFMKCFPDAHFVSGYDHPDYYSLDLHRNPFEIRRVADRHWKTAASTCLTFMTTKKYLRLARRQFESYGRGNIDVSMWLSITKSLVWNIPRFIKYRFSNHFFYEVIRNCWTKTLIETLCAPKLKLWVARPSLSTHMEHNMLAPRVNWLDLFKLQCEELGIDI